MATFDQATYTLRELVELGGGNPGDVNARDRARRLWRAAGVEPQGRVYLRSELEQTVLWESMKSAHRDRAFAAEYRTPLAG